MSGKGIHTDHRKRMRARFLEGGLGSFNEHEVLELLLFYCIPRRDTNAIAHNLINRFGSLARVMNAPMKELKKIDGVGENAALFIALIRELSRYCDIKQNESCQILKTIDECGRYLVPYFEGKARETVYLLCLDAKCKVLCCREVEEGNVNSAGISIRKIVDMALTENATSVVLAHNHPSGVALPSPEDVLTTRKLAQALNLVDVVLIDHVVVADDDYVSLVHSGMYRPDTAVVG